MANSGSSGSLRLLAPRLAAPPLVSESEEGAAGVEEGEILSDDRKELRDGEGLSVFSGIFCFSSMEFRSTSQILPWIITMSIRGVLSFWLSSSSSSSSMGRFAPGVVGEMGGSSKDVFFFSW